MTRDQKCRNSEKACCSLCISFTPQSAEKIRCMQCGNCEPNDGDDDHVHGISRSERAKHAFLTIQEELERATREKCARYDAHGNSHDMQGHEDRHDERGKRY
jgi:hypothetical protein